MALTLLGFSTLLTTITAERCAAKTATVVPAGTLTPEKVVSMHQVRGVALSPDGRWAAYEVVVPRGLDEERGEAYVEIWLADTVRGNARRFTAEKQRASAPAFSPDGKQLAFLSMRSTGSGEDKEEKNDLFVIDVTGGEASALTHGEYAISAFRWSPKGDRIAFMAESARTQEEKDARKKGRDWVAAERELRPVILWSVGLADRAVKRVTQTDVHVWGFDWAPDGQALVVQIADTPRADDWYLFSRLALVPAAGGTPAPLVRTEGKLEQARFAPDGKHVAWRGATDIHDPFAGSIYVASTTGGEAKQIAPRETGAVTALEWLDASTIVYATSRGTASALACAALDNGTSWDVITQGPAFTGFSLSRDRRMLALTGSTSRHPTELFAGALSRRRCDLRRLTTTNPDIERAQLGTQEVVRWKAEDGLEIEGVLLKPLGFTSGVRYPLVVVAHGGPEGCTLNGWTTSWLGWGQLLAQRGFMVLFPNYRGSIGRGEAFERGDHKDLGGREFGDVLAGIDELVRRGWVDRARVGIGGGSYGGYFSAWAATAHSDRFAAAVDFAGISNWTSMQGVSDIPLENAMVHWELPFYDNMQLYWERSPMAHVNDCRTPLLIGHGDKDNRVPPGQGVELYTALRLLGKEVQLVRYPRAGHGLNEVAHQLDFLNRSLDWYEKHLLPEPEAAAR